jgi:hypothetical protein
MLLDRAMIEFPVFSHSETSAPAEFDVLLTFDTDGAVLPLSEESVGVALQNISEPPPGQFALVLYRIDAGEWAELPPGRLFNLDMDCSAQTLSVKRAKYSGNARVRVTIVGVPSGLYAEDRVLAGDGGGGVPGGADKQVQFNDGGAFGADPSFTYDKTQFALSVVDHRSLVTTLGQVSSSTGTLNFANAASPNFTAIQADAAGALEVNNGTTGQFRDLIARIVTARTGPQSVVVDSSYGGVFVYYEANPRIHFSQYGVRMVNSCEVGWSSDGANCNVAFDAGISRNAAGVVEINNGTAGQYRDLKCRAIIATGLPTSAAGLPSGSLWNNGGVVNIAP